MRVLLIAALLVTSAACSGNETGPAPLGTPVDPAHTSPPASGRWVTGYWVGYQRSLYPESQIDFTLMTHVIVGAIQATSAGGVTTDFYIDGIAGPPVARTIATRAHAAGRKAILMLGGDGSLAPLRSATSNSTRATFVANLLKTMDDLGYDGIDVDWEPLSMADEPQVLQFVRDLRSARPRMLITFPVGWVGTGTTPEPWYAQVASVVDQVNVMSYGMADAWPGWTSWHEAALYGEAPSHPSSVSTTIDFYRGAGVPAAKLGVGVGAYGSCWRGPGGMSQTPGAGVVASDNTMSYANIMAQYYTAASYRWDAAAHQGYLSFATQTGSQRCTMISYEDAPSITDKAAYVRSAGLGGLMMWTVNQGHVNAGTTTLDPLLAAAYRGVAP